MSDLANLSTAELADWLDAEAAGGHKRNAARLISALEEAACRLRALTEWRPAGEVEFDEEGMFEGVALVKVVIDRDVTVGYDPMVLCQSNSEEIPLANVIGVRRELPEYTEGR